MRILVNDFAGHPFQIQLSRNLARLGHKLLHTYFGANNTPKGNVSARSENLELDNVAIGGTFKKHSVLSRRNTDISYGHAISDRIKVFRPDIVLSANTPLDAQRIILATAHSCNSKFIFWLQDMLSIGIEFVLRKKGLPLSGLAGAYYRRMERRLLSESDAIVCIAPEFIKTLEAWKLGLSNLFVIENWAPLDEVPTLPRINNWSAENDLNEKFCFMYSGTLGMKHKPELLLDLARHFKGNDKVAICVIGEGAGADWLKRHHDDTQTSSMRFFPFQPYERIPEVLATADVLITLLDEGCGVFAVPSKTLAYLCAGRSLLVAAPEDNLTAKIVRSAGAGIATPTQIAPFLAAADNLLKDNKFRSACAKHSRDYAENAFDIKRICGEFLHVFDFVMGRVPESDAQKLRHNAKT